VANRPRDERARGQGSIPGRRKDTFFFSIISRLALGSIRPFFTIGTRGVDSPAEERRGRESDHSPPSVLDYERRSYTLTPPIRVYAVVL
jgi:hypothetical protein